MSELVKLKTENQISFISMDDGKANAMSVEMLEGLNAALDQAEQSGSVVIYQVGRMYYLEALILEYLRAVTTQRSSKC